MRLENKNVNKLEDADALLTPINSAIMLLEAKLENDIVLENQALKKIKESNINTVDGSKLNDIIEIVDKIKVDEHSINKQLLDAEETLMKIK